jgi:uroporphyrinogen decarboxylase
MEIMTSRERVIAAIKHQTPDRVPLDMTICEKPFMGLMDYFGINKTNLSEPDKWGEIPMIPELAKALGIDFLFIKSGKPKKKDKESYTDLSTDDWGVVRKKVFLKNGSYYWEIVKHPLKDATVEDLKHFAWPDPDDEGIYRNLSMQAKNLYENTEYCLVGRFNSSIFETAWYLRGLEKFLIDLIRNQQFAQELLNRIYKIQVKTAEQCLKLAGKYIQILRFGDDLGTQMGPLISPDVFRKIVKPVLCKAWTVLKSKFRLYNPEGFIMFHSCGNVYPFIPDFIGCSLDILDPLQKVPGMEIKKLKQEFGDKLTFHGAIDTQYLLPYASPAEVKSEVKKIVEILGKNGGFIAAPVHNVQADVPVKNLLALSEAVREHLFT